MKDPLGRCLAAWRIRVVQPHVRGRLLDIGCGLNRLVRGYGGQGVGVDVHQWGDVDLIVPDTARLPFGASEFDTVTFLACLNHISNRQAVLGEARRVLKPGGRVLITMIPPGISRVWHFLRRPWDADRRERGVTEGEVWGLTQRALANLLRSSGLRLVRAKRFMAGINCLFVAEADDRPTPPAAAGAG